MNGESLQSWVKSLAPSIFAALTVAILLWLNVPSKSEIQELKTDIRELRKEVRAVREELHKDLRELRSEYTNHLSYHLDSGR